MKEFVELPDGIVVARDLIKSVTEIDERINSAHHKDTWVFYVTFTDSVNTQKGYSAAFGTDEAHFSFLTKKEAESEHKRIRDQLIKGIEEEK